MCERRTVKVVLDRDVLRHKQECMDNYFAGVWVGLMTGLGVGIIVGGLIAKLASVW